MGRPPRSSPASAGLSIRAFAKRIGFSHTAIRKAIAAGRLKDCVGQQNGQPYIKDPDIGEKEWSANAGRVPRGVQASTKQPVPAAEAPTDPPKAETAPPPETTRVETSPPTTPAVSASAGIVGTGAPQNLAEANMRLAYQREVQLVLENQEKRGQLIDAAEARREAYRCARSVRDALLNIPDRLAAELAAESDVTRVHIRLDGEIRQALELLHEVLRHGE